MPSIGDKFPHGIFGKATVTEILGKEAIENQFIRMPISSILLY